MEQESVQSIRIEARKKEILRKALRYNEERKAAWSAYCDRPNKDLVESLVFIGFVALFLYLGLWGPA